MHLGPSIEVVRQQDIMHDDTHRQRVCEQLVVVESVPSVAQRVELGPALCVCWQLIVNAGSVPDAGGAPYQQMVKPKKLCQLLQCRCLGMHVRLAPSRCFVCFSVIADRGCCFSVVADGGGWQRRAPMKKTQHSRNIVN